MRVVFDTNVIVSAILRDRLPETVLLFVIGHPEHEWVASEEILQEYRKVLTRPKFKLTPELLKKWEDRIQQAAAEWPEGPGVALPRDVHDEKFLSCALAAEADFLVTGDKDFAGAKQVGKTKIVSVRQFHDLVCQSASS